MASWSKVLVLAVLVLGGAAVGRPHVSPGDGPEPVETVARPAADALPLLAAAPHGDGDSWKDTQGQEYRLGIVNAPEVDECFGAQATAERQRLTAGGFRAEVYSTDGYGRGVAVVTLRTAATSTSTSRSRASPTTAT
jgi:endonuclease YncB( thermonuclease family)